MMNVTNNLISQKLGAIKPLYFTNNSQTTSAPSTSLSGSNLISQYLNNVAMINAASVNKTEAVNKDIQEKPYKNDLRDLFLTNKDQIFLNKIIDSLKKCNSFSFSVSFIKKAGLILFERELEEALERGVKGKLITSTYQNFTDIASLEYFMNLQSKYPNFECHLDYECFGDNGFHSKGYLFEYEYSYEFIVGSTNITRFALLKNVEWNVSLYSKEKMESYNQAM